MPCPAMQVEAVLRLAQAAGKPLVVDEFNVQRPISQRNEGLRLIYGVLQNASSSVAGQAWASCSKHPPLPPPPFLLSMLTEAKGKAWGTHELLFDLRLVV